VNAAEIKPEIGLNIKKKLFADIADVDHIISNP
jgi:hypothetical protein